MIESAPAPVLKERANFTAAYVCKIGLALLVVASMVTAGLAFVYPLFESKPFWGIWEDSFMLVRYADNLLHGSGLIWNPGGRPTYGLTSVFYVVPVALIQSFIPHKPLVSLATTSFLSGCFFVGSMAILLRPFWRIDRAVRTAVGLVLVISFARISTSLSVHFWSGMDTMFVLGMVTGYLLIAMWQQRTGTLRATVVMGIAGGLLYGVRPDLLIYSFLIPASIALLSKDKKTRVKGWMVLSITVVTTAALLISFYLYFGTALPLSFYAKGLKLYGDFEYEHYKEVPYEQFAAYARSCGLLFGVILLDLIDWMESRSKTARSPFEVALLCGTAAYCLYYLFFVLQIMEFNARFYYPTLPALLWLGSNSTTRLAHKYWPWLQNTFRLGTGWGWTLALLATGAILVGHPLIVNGRQVARVAPKGIVSWDQRSEYRAYWSDYWFRLDRFSELPSDFKIATTEIGHPAAMNPGKIVIDMAGLNERQFATHPFSAAVLLEKYSPDLIYMPHPGYRGMNRELQSNPRFVSEYEYFPAAVLGPTVRMGLAIRRDSKYYARMRSIINAD